MRGARALRRAARSSALVVALAAASARTATQVEVPDGGTTDAGTTATAPSDARSVDAGPSRSPLETVPAQRLAFENARLALREHRPQDALRFWLLRNALSMQGQGPTDDADFRSVVWAALGETGFCPDGFIEDDTGAGLWPLAVHNWLAKNVAKQRAAPQPQPWTALHYGMQQRFFSLNDVLTAEELKAARFFRADCITPVRMLPRLPTLQWIDMEDRFSVGLMMRDLIELASITLHKDKVEGRALLQTRRFDLDTALARMALARVRKDSSLTSQLLRSAGVAEGGTERLRAQRLDAFRTSKDTVLWKRALTRWSVTDWLALSRTRRLALFAEASGGLADIESSSRVTLMLVDALLERKNGEELASWLGFAGESADPTLLPALTQGARGELLLALSPETGFRERAAIALHRGVDALQVGSLLEALRAFAFALGHADDSREAEAVHRLAQRWLSFVLSQYDTDEEVLEVLRQYVPPADTNAVLETLVWRAAFHADRGSFDHVAANIRRGGSLERTVRLLEPLAGGDAGGMWRALSAALKDEQSGIVLFTQQLVERLALEPIDVRSANAATLAGSLLVLDAANPRVGPSLQRKIGALRERIQALRDGIGAYDASVRGRVASGTPGHEAYAGSVRLAPADALPWPFVAPRPVPPNPFAPVQLIPVEWRRDDGPLVYGWRLQE